MTKEIEEPDLNRPFDQYLPSALTYAAGNGPDPTGSELFHLVRALKAHPEAMHLGPERVLQVIQLYIHHRRPQALHWVDFASEDTVVQFHSMWERARFPLGIDPLQQALEVAGDGLIRGEKSRPGRFNRVITAAAVLQVLRNRKPIMLPVNQLAELMLCEPNTVSKWIQWASNDGMLIKTAEHKFSSQGQSKASEYVFGLHRWGRGPIQVIADRAGVSIPTGLLGWTEEQFSSHVAT